MEPNIGAVLQNIGMALDHVAWEIAELGMILKEVEVEFATDIEKIAGAKYEIKIFGFGLSLGASRDWEKTNTVCVTLTPRKEAFKGMTRPDFEQGLLDALSQIHEAVFATPDGYETTAASVEIGFIVTDDAGVELVVIGETKQKQSNILRMKLESSPAQ